MRRQQLVAIPSLGEAGEHERDEGNQNHNKTQQNAHA